MANPERNVTMTTYRTAILIMNITLISRDNEAIELAVPGSQMTLFSPLYRPRNAFFDSQQMVKNHIMFKMRIAVPKVRLHQKEQLMLQPGKLVQNGYRMSTRGRGAADRRAILGSTTAAKWAGTPGG